MKVNFFLTLLLLQFSLINAQDFEFGRIVQEESMMTKYHKDTTAHAVVIREYGKAYINDDVKLIFNYHVRIKILSITGIENGNVEIPLYKSEATKYEKVSDIQAVTINVKTDGSVSKSQLEPSQIFKENVNKHWDVVKFALPNVQEGSIIEYKYKIESPYKFNFKKWQFQSHIPKIHSEYLAKIPAVYNYNISLTGNLKLKQESKLERECFNPGGGFKADCSNLTFIMNDIPAFIEEDYMISAVNFLSAINFELKDYTNSNGVKTLVTKDWKNIDYELKTFESFGKQYTKKGLFKDEIIPVIAGKTDELEKAKAIYKHMQTRFRWNGQNSCYSDEGIKKALSQNSGNVGDINLSLIAAMNAANIKAEPVILSTRQNGLVNNLFPVISDFNYVVCKVEIGESSYLLDATDPLLPFGLLPIRCINGQGRVMSRSSPSYWIDLVASQKEVKYHKMNLTLEEDGKLRGTMELNSAGYEGWNKRKKIKSFGSLDEYVENLDENLPGLKILNAEFKYLDDLDLAISEIYEVEIDAFESLDHDRIFFNPFLMNKITSNPFKLKERSYPVDWGAPSDHNTFIQIKFPEKFILQSKPEKVGVILPGDGGRFFSEVKVENSVLTLQQVLQFKKSMYGTEEYHYLKDMYNKIIQAQKFDVVFKKEI